MCTVKNKIFSAVMCTVTGSIIFGKVDNRECVL
jgi:hypothetical protein